MTGNGDPLLVVTWTCGGCGRRLRKQQPARIDLEDLIGQYGLATDIDERTRLRKLIKLHRRVEIACPYCDPELDVGVVEEVEDGDD